MKVSTVEKLLFKGGVNLEQRKILENYIKPYKLSGKTPRTKAYNLLKDRLLMVLQTEEELVPDQAAVQVTNAINVRQKFMVEIFEKERQLAATQKMDFPDSPTSVVAAVDASGQFTQPMLGGSDLRAVSILSH